MQLEAAYILGRRPFKESSLLLDVFTPEQGCFSIIANSALKNKHAWSALLQVFQPLILSWTGKSSLKTLTSVEAPSPAIALNGRSLFSAYYVNELILKLLPKDVQGSSSFSTLFAMYSKCLNDLLMVGNIEHPLRVFEYYLLDEIDLLPDFKFDHTGTPIVFEKHYLYFNHQGFVSCDEFVSEQSIHNQRSFSGELLHHYAKFEPDFLTDAYFLTQAKYLMRTLINAHLGGYELKSKSLFQSNLSFRRNE